MVLLVFRFVLMFACLSTPGVYSTSSFPWNSKRAWNNGAWGDFCYDLTTYTPTCGWQIVLKSPVWLNKIEVWDSFYTTSDNFVFTLTNLSFSGNFKLRNQCVSMSLNGLFGNSFPDVVLTWLCVCDASTKGQCKAIYSPSTIGDLGTGANHPLLGAFSAADKTVRAVSGKCYVGDHSVVLSEDTHLIDCASLCADLTKCTGINYRPGTNQCDLVYEVVDMNPRLLGTDAGCSFWKVIHT